MAAEAPVTRRERSAWPIAVGVVLVTALAFAPTLGNGFVNWDDDLNLTENGAYRGLSPSHLRWMLTTTLGGHWQPLTWLSFALDHALWGMDPRGYHLTSLGLHALNALLVWLIFRSLLRRLTTVPQEAAAWIAAAGALGFAVHPLRVESVAWATERRDVLSGAFWLLAVLAYLRAAEASVTTARRARAFVVAALVLSLAAKAWAVTFPVVLLILDWYPLERLERAPRLVLREKLPIAVVAAGAGALAFAAQRAVPEMRSLAEHGVAARAAQAAYGLIFYLAKTLWPAGLQPAYLLPTPLDPAAPRYVAAVIAVVVVTAIAVRGRARRPGILAAWAGYVVILAPVLGLTQTGPQLVADRYSYLACLPPTALAMVALARRWARASALAARLLAGATVATLVVLAALTFRQASIWHDSVTLWDHTLGLDPCNWIALTNRGFARQDRDRDAAIADYTSAIRCNPRYCLAYFDRGTALQERGDYAAAAADHSKVIELRPNDPGAYNNRGWARQSLGDFAGAASDYERALALAPPGWSARAMVAANLAAARARLTANVR